MNKTIKHITIQVIANSNHQKIVEDQDDFLKIKLKSPAHEGKANAELIKLLAKKYKVSKSQVEIVKGLVSKQKLVRIYR